MLARKDQRKQGSLGGGECIAALVVGSGVRNTCRSIAPSPVQEAKDLQARESLLLASAS